jgi:hypothetical protein
MSVSTMTIAAKLRQLPIGQLAEIARAAAARCDDEGDIVLNVALMVLEHTMPEAEFIAFCEEFA